METWILHDYIGWRCGICLSLLDKGLLKRENGADYIICPKCNATNRVLNVKNKL